MPPAADWAVVLKSAPLEARSRLDLVVQGLKRTDLCKRGYHQRFSLHDLLIVATTWRRSPAASPGRDNLPSRCASETGMDGFEAPEALLGAGRAIRACSA